MNISRGDEEAWEAHVQTQIKNQEQRVEELRERGQLRVGRGSTQQTSEGQLTVDLTSEHQEDSQKTELGSPTHTRKGQQGAIDDQWQALGTERMEPNNHEKGTDPQ
eukprot:4276472-Heterocapsa_arctica.AAC.1